MRLTAEIPFRVVPSLWSQDPLLLQSSRFARWSGTKMPSRDHQGIGYASSASNANVASQCSPM
jgi:hypothetical protein